MGQVLSFRRISTVALLALLTLCANVAAADPVAVIAAVRGKVEVTPVGSKQPQRALFGRTLQRGDRVTVGPSANATVFFSDGNVIELSEKSTVTIGGQVSTKGAGGSASLSSDVYAQVSKFVTAGSRQSGLVALSEMRGAADESTPILIAPRRTSVLGTSPTFSWRAVEGATRYRVKMSSAESGELWTREVTELSLPYPADAAALAAGADYLWEVEALSDLKPLRRESTVFHLLPAGMAESVRANLTKIGESAGGGDSPAARYLAGSYLSGLGLYLDASEQFAELCKLSPDSPAPHEALGSVYTKVGLMDLAASEFQQALALAREP